MDRTSPSEPDVLLEMRDGVVRSVTYVDQPWPSPGLMRRHRETYGPMPFRVLTPVTGARRTCLDVDASGTVVEQTEQEIGRDGDVLAETRRTPGGQFLERIEYEYDENGEIRLTRELDEDGTVRQEWES